MKINYPRSPPAHSAASCGVKRFNVDYVKTYSPLKMRPGYTIMPFLDIISSSTTFRIKSAPRIFNISRARFRSFPL